MYYDLTYDITRYRGLKYGGPEGYSLVVFATSALEPSLVEPSLVEPSIVEPSIVELR